MKTFYDILKKYTTTIGEATEVDKILAWPIIIQEIFGQQILNTEWEWRKKILKHIFWMFLIIYVIIGTIKYLENTDDLTSKGEAYYTFVIISVFIVKYWAFTINRTRFQNVYLIAKTRLLQMIKEISPKKANHIIVRIKIVVKIYLTTIFLPVFMYIILAMWSNIHGGERVTLSKTTATLLPVTSPYYEFSFILHVLFLLYMSFTICIIDMWFVLVIFFFCTSCDCLVMTLKIDTQKKHESNVDYAVRLNDMLRVFYKNHRDLMKYYSIFTDMYKWSSLIPLCTVLLAFCILMFLMSEEVNWNLIANFVPMIVEILAYNWYGEQLKLKTQQLKIAILEFDWLSMQHYDKRKYLIIVTFMNKEFGVKTAFGNILSLETMTDVLKASYQAFTLLKTMKN